MATNRDETKARTALGYLMRNFTKKHRVSVHDRDKEDDVWYMYISPLNITLAALGLLIIMIVAVILIVVYTPVLDKLPGYPGRQARIMLLENVARIDSLESEARLMQAYSDDVLLIMEGKIPAMAEMSRPSDSIKSERKAVSPSKADSILRSQLESGGRFGLVNGEITTSGAIVKRMEFVAPIRGEVIAKFDAKNGVYGIGIVPSGAQEVVASQAGTVVMSQWTPEDGNTIQVQHGDNYISFYKHNAQLLKRVGDRVESGEVIGFVEPGVVDKATRPSGELIFELWASGVPVDPQRYVMFK